VQVVPSETAQNAETSENAERVTGGQRSRLDELSLAGFTVGITADRRWEEQAELLQRRSCAVLHGPTIRTLPVGPDEELFEVTERLLVRRPDYVVANTGIGMRAWIAAAESWGLGEPLLSMFNDSQVFARGPKASAAMHQAGVNVTAKAGSERLDELIGMLIEADVRGRTVAFQRHGDESPDAMAQLRAAGATVIEVPVYRWILPVDLEPALGLVEAIVSGSVQAVTFTSAPAVRNLFLIAEENGLAKSVRAALNGKVLPMTVGPVCAAAAVESGISNPLVPDRFRIGPMIRTLTEALRSTGQRLSINGIPASFRGTELTVGTESVALSEKETALLAALMMAAPKVLSRSELLARLWTADTDPHVIEVTVARLRRRLGTLGLGALGSSIVAVPRRGYMVRS
jgi:uroporphyrinogen-III synthase